MGYISDLASQKASPPKKDHRSKWREVFGTNKEREGPEVRPVPGGAWNRSSIAQPAAYKRLLEAMRSMAPGGWSDDRWEQSKHFTGISYVGIDRVCRQLGQAEFAVEIEDPSAEGGKRPVRPEDPPQGDRMCKPYDLVKLLKRPNNQDSFGKWMYRMGQQLKLTGTALDWIVPNMFGTPCEMYVIPTAIAIPQPAINPDFPDGYYRIQPIYPYGPFSSYPTPATAVGAPIPAQWMLRFLYPHPLLRYDGYSPLTAMRLHIDALEMIDKSRHYKMRRSSNPDAVLNPTDVNTSELTEDEIARMHAEWENEKQGPENAGKLIIGTPGWEIDTSVGTSPREMDYGSSWDQLLSFILGGGFGITKPAAGMVEDSSYSTLWGSLRQLQWLTLEPDCDEIAADATHHLASKFGDTLTIKIRPKPLDDKDQLMAEIGTGISAKCITKNEVRKKLGYPPFKDKRGDEIAGAEEQDMLEQAMGQEMVGPGPKDEMEMERPSTGPGMEGALGPRGKGLYGLKINGNGNGHHKVLLGR